MHFKLLYKESKFQYLHFSARKTEIQKGDMTYPESPRRLRTEIELELLENLRCKENVLIFIASSLTGVHCCLQTGRPPFNF